MSKLDYAVFIGRFQLPHKAHFELMEKALEEADNLIIAIGSANRRRSLRNPFSYEQRVMIIEHGATEAIKKALLNGRVRFVPLDDNCYVDQWWVENVQKQIKIILVNGRVKNPTVGLIGCDRDETTYYLNMFPQWQAISVEQTKQFAATDCRNAYYEFGIDDKRAVNKLYDFTTSGVINTLRYIPSHIYDGLHTRFKFVSDYRERWGEGPHYTADPVVIKSGHILLVRRSEEPDIDALAFPGGFIDKGEDSEFAARRECAEETKLVLLEHTCKVSGDYAMPFRDDRGDIRTTAHLYDLGTGPLTPVEAGSDAKEALWVPFADLSPQNMAADHYFIFKDLLRKV